MFAADSPPLLGAIGLVAIFWIGGALVAGLSWRLARGDIGRNRTMGLRIPSTMRSDEAWHAGQVAFAPWGMASGLGAALIAAPVLARPSQGWVVFLLSLASIWLVVLPALGAFLGDQAAKEVGER